MNKLGEELKVSHKEISDLNKEVDYYWEEMNKFDIIKEENDANLAKLSALYDAGIIDEAGDLTFQKND